MCWLFWIFWVSFCVMIIKERNACSFKEELQNGSAICILLKLWSVLCKLHKLILRSSAERYVSSSLLTDIELTWYVCALAYILRGLASTINGVWWSWGITKLLISCGCRSRVPSSDLVFSGPSMRRFRSEIFHNFIVLSKKQN